MSNRRHRGTSNKKGRGTKGLKVLRTVYLPLWIDAELHRIALSSGRSIDNVVQGMLEEALVKW